MTLPPITYFELSSNLFPIIAALRKKSDKRGAAYFIIVFFTGTLAVEIVTYIMALHRINNHGILNIYNIFEFYTFGCYFYFIDVNHNLRMFYRYIGVVFLIAWVVLKCSIEPFSVPAVLSHTLSAGLLTCMAVRTLYLIMNDEQIILYRDERFWIAIATVFNYFTNIVMYGYLNAFTHISTADVIRFWSIHWTLSIAANILFALAFIWNRKP